MHIETGSPLTGKKLQMVKALLAMSDLTYEEDVDFSVLLMDGEEPVATGSLAENVLKGIAVAPDRQGQDLTAKILTELRKEALRLGRHHLFLFTKPDNRRYFADFGFYALAATEEVLLMENRKDGALRFARSLAEESQGLVGAVVVNCNPFTLGHRYLIQTAAAQCDLLHVFVLTEDRSYFPAADRLELVRLGTADLAGVRVHATGPYMISNVTFPTYFLKDAARAEAIACRLDLEIFASIFAPALGISRRFVGSEPNCPVTAAYNRAMEAFLPARGIDLLVIPRKEKDGLPISASRVRALLEAGRLEETEALVPPTTYRYLLQRFKKGGMPS